MRVTLAGMLAWLFPGLGHIYLGYWKRGVILLVTITAIFWSGVAIGGVRGTVDWHNRKAWFIAELCTGGNTLAAATLHKAIGPARKTSKGFDPHTGHWLAVDVGVHYAGVAGLLNLLVILDALARADIAMRPRRGNPTTARGAS